MLELEIHDLSRGGAGVAKEVSGRIVFVPFTAPGDRVRVRILEETKNYAQAELVETVRPSPLRVQPRCPVFQRCGGCEWQHLPYDYQWKTKVQGVLHSLRRVGVLGKEEPFPLEELPAERIWEYRNRIQLRGEGSQVGFFARSSKTLVPIERCDIARPELNALLPKVKEAGSKETREYKVELEVFENGQTAMSWNQGHAALGFRQVHEDQDRKLRTFVKSNLTAGRVIFDLYGGNGNLSLHLAEEMRQIYCVDVAAGTGFSAALPPHFSFEKASALKWLMKFVQSHPSTHPASAILDPPREGLGKDFAEIASALERLGTQEILAIGCQSDNWASDLSRWIKRGWALQKLGVLDLFPHTHHAESLAVLRKVS